MKHCGAFLPLKGSSAMVLGDPLFSKFITASITCSSISSEIKYNRNKNVEILKNQLKVNSCSCFTVSDLVILRIQRKVV